MSPGARFTDAARWQLRAAIESVRRRDPGEAAGLLRDVRLLVRDTSALEARGAPLPEFAELPHREVRVGGHRIFFRAENKTLWIAGIWRTHEPRQASR